MNLQRLIYLLICLACTGLLGFGFYLEYVKGLEPCPLCLLQRLFFALVGTGGLIAALHDPKEAWDQHLQRLSSLGSLSLNGRCSSSILLAGVSLSQVWREE